MRTILILHIIPLKALLVFAFLCTIQSFEFTSVLEVDERGRDIVGYGIGQYELIN